MKKQSGALLAFILIVSSCPAKAQAQHSAWLATFQAIRTGSSTSIHFDGQLRSTDELKQFQTILLRPGLNLHLTKRLTLSAGYAFISNRRNISPVSDMVTEHRIWQQLLYSHPVKKTTLSHRFRVEQRFLPTITVQGTELQTQDYGMSGRLRYFIRHLIPFSSSTTFSKGPFGAWQNEVFLNVTGRDRVNGEYFDQNRLYLALGYRIHPAVDLEAGYLNQYSNGRGTAFSNNHVFQLASYFRL